MSKLFNETGLQWLWLTAVIVIADQASKVAIMNNMSLYQSVPLAPFLNFTYVHNYGAAFSFLADHSGWQRWFLTAVALIVSVVLVWWLKKTPKQQVLVSVAFALILAGAIGNVYDRIAYGYVIDFIDVYYNNWHWPAFNIADSAISIGAGLMIFDAIFGNQTTEQNQETN